MYFVYTEKHTKQAALEIHVEKIKNLGGAAKIIFHNGQYYLVSSVYFLSEQAEEVKGNIIKNFPNSGVLKIDIPKVKSSIKKQIKQDEKILMAFRFIVEASEKYQSNMISYMSGTILQSELSMNILKDKLKVEEMIKNFSKNSELSSNIFNYLNMMILYYDNFFDQLFESQRKEYLVSEFAVLFAELEWNMRKSL